MAERRSLGARVRDAVFLLGWGAAGAGVEVWLRRKECRRRERQERQEREGLRP